MTVNFKDTVDVGGFRIQNLADPATAQEAATRKYVLDQIAGIGATYTDEQARDAVAGMLVAGNNIDITYVDDAGNPGTITIDVEALTSADIGDFNTAARAAISVTDTATLDLSYNSTTGALSGAVLDSPTLGGASLAQVRDHSLTTGSRLATSSTTLAATDRLLGRDTAAGGATEELTVGGGIEFTGTGGIRTSAFTGDVTKTAGGTATTIANDVVTNAKLANAPANTFKGNNTGSLGDPVDMTVAQAKALLALAAADISDFSTAADARVAAVVTGGFVSGLAGVDADTLGGSTKAQVVSDAIAGVVDTAPSTLDTLNELAAALGDDPNFATTISNALALRVQSYAANVGDGTATTYTITHNLNTRDVVVQIYENGDDYEQVWATVKRATVNTVTVTFGTAPTAAQYRVVVQGRA